MEETKTTIGVLLASDKDDIKSWITEKHHYFCYEKGVGCEKDENLAFYWYKKAAEQGNAIAQYNLGLCYKKGEGVEKNIDEAIKWFSKCAEQGDEDAK